MRGVKPIFTHQKIFGLIQFDIQEGFFAANELRKNQNRKHSCGIRSGGTLGHLSPPSFARQVNPIPIGDGVDYAHNIPYFLIQFLRELFFFEFGNCRKFKYIVAANFNFLNNKLNFYCGKYSREGTIQGRKQYEDIRQACPHQVLEPADGALSGYILHPVGP